MSVKPTRRDVLIRGGAVATLAACSRGTTGEAPVPPPPEPIKGPAEPGVVRVASVKTAVEGNVLPTLIKDFEAATPYRIELVTGTRVYEGARNGEIDLVVSHYGHRDAEAFVLDGLGEWPRTIFSNQMALIGPPGDPARIRGLEDAAVAFGRIAETRSKFVVNAIDGVQYLTDILWHAAGKPDRAGWLIDDHTAKEAALVKASQLGAYTLWGLTPFLRLDAAAAQLALEPLVLADPLLQRMLVSVIVKPGGVRHVNVAGAQALQAFFLTPATQARIRTIHYPGSDAVNWVPAGRHNRTAMLPKG